MNATGNITFWFAGVYFCAAALTPLSAVEPLESHREVERLWMGMEEGVVRPAAYEQIRAEAEGYVSLHAQDGKQLAIGDRWATLDPEQLEIEKKAFELDQTKLKLQLVKSREDAREAHVRMGLEQHEAERKREDLLSVAQDAGIPAVLRQRAGEAAAELAELIAAARDTLDPEKHQQELKLLDEDCELQIARRLKQLTLLEKRSNLIAGFNGDLRLGDSVKEKLASGKTNELLWMKAGELIGTIVDDRHYEISVSASGPLLAEIPQNELLVFLQDSRSGKLIAGEYTRTDEVDNGREILRNFVFVIREDGVEGARFAQGTRNLVHVYRKFTRPYRLVHKKDIVFLAPDVLETGGWNGLVTHLWPGCRVIQVGPQTIAVEPKDAN